MLIVIDGPEKAGKTTLVTALASDLRRLGHLVTVHKQGPWEPNDAFIAPRVKSHAHDSVIHIWDRAWASEEVYATLLNRRRRANGNPFLMEWLHGRATPHKFILLPTDIEYNARLRDDTDLPVNPGAEYSEFAKYRDYGYKILYNSYTAEDILSNISTVYASMDRKSSMYAPISYVYGSPEAKIVFVAPRNEGCKFDRWMPLSYNAAYEMFSEVLGTAAFKCAYMFAHVGNPALLADARLVTAIGKEAADWVHYYGPAKVYPKLHRQSAINMREFRNHLTNIKELI